MLGHRELTPEDYVAILRRRKWWIIIPAVIAPLIAFGISLKLDSKYTSQTLVLVEQQKVPEGFVKPVVTEQLNERLATMQEQILSRTRLQPIIERFGLFKDDPKLSMEDKIEEMRKMIKVSPVRADFGGANRGGLPGFYISFTAPSARLAQQVCTEITSMFMQENLHVREQAAQGTTDFLTGQLADAKRNLDEQDSKLAAFKRKYIGQLPGQEQSNFNMLTNLNSQLGSLNDALNRLQQERTYTESLMASQLSNWNSTQKNNTDPQVLETQLAAAQAQLLTLESKYTSTHPDVIKLKNDIASMQKQLASNSSSSQKVPPAAPSSHEPVAVQQLRAQLGGINSAIKAKEKDQAQVSAQIRNYEARLQLSPVIEEQYKSLTRDYQTAVTNYNDLLNKKNQSEMATDLERKQQGEQFRVMDPPNLPEKPTFPNRPLFAAGGLAGGLIVGLVIAVGLELKDKAIRTERDVEYFLKLPTLAMVPRVRQAGDNGQRKGLFKRRKHEMASAKTGTVGA